MRPRSRKEALNEISEPLRAIDIFIVKSREEAFVHIKGHTGRCSPIGDIINVLLDCILKTIKISGQFRRREKNSNVIGIF